MLALDNNTQCNVLWSEAVLTTDHCCWTHITPQGACSNDNMITEGGSYQYFSHKLSALMLGMMNDGA